MLDSSRAQQYSTSTWRHGAVSSSNDRLAATAPEADSSDLTIMH
jgi:hypothetical protein